jgi:hypothetical protein
MRSQLDIARPNSVLATTSENEVGCAMAESARGRRSAADTIDAVIS